VWADHFTVDVGRVRVGVRADRAELGELLRAALGPLVVDDADSTPNYAVRFGESSRDFHVLYWGGCMQARSVDPRRVLRALLLHLGAHAHVPDGLLRAHVAVGVRDGRAVLAPPIHPNELAATVRRLQDRGVTMLDAPFADLDLARREVVVADRFAYDERALDELVAALPPPRRDDPGLPAGRYPIDRWLFFDREGRGVQPISRAAATVAAASAVRRGNLDDLLGRLAALTDRVPSFAVRPTTVAETVEAVAGAPGGEAAAR
jgi:hypothetical protein